MKRALMKRASSSTLLFKLNDLNKNLSAFFLRKDDHDTCLMYKIQIKIVIYLKTCHPKITKINYFSGGCATQYINHKNFINLCYHKIDFNINAEWTFFTTNKGKLICIGRIGRIGRVVKDDQQMF